MKGLILPCSCGTLYVAERAVRARGSKKVRTQVKTRAKDAGYYCDVSRWRRFGADTFLDSFRLADKIRKRLRRRRN